MIFLNNNVTNVGNTPSINANTSTVLPDPLISPIGALYITTDTNEFLRNDGTAWIPIAAGTGSTPTLEQVLTAGNVANNNGIELINTTTLGFIKLTQNYFSDPRIDIQKDNDFSFLKQDKLALANLNFITEINADGYTVQDITGLYFSRVYIDRFQISQNGTFAGISYANIGSNAFYSYFNDSTQPEGFLLQPDTKVYNFGNFQYGTYIEIDAANSIIQTLISNYRGFKLDFGTNTYSLGDYATIVNGSYISINDDNKIIGLQAGSNFNNTSLILNDASSIIQTQYQNNEIGFKLDFANEIYTFGDWSMNGRGLKIDSNNLLYYLGQDGLGLKINSNNQNYSLGDYDYSGANGCNIYIDDTSGIIQTRVFGNLGRGIKLDNISGIYYFGDYDLANNSTRIEVNDNTQQIFLYNNTSGLTCDGNVTIIGDFVGIGNNTEFGIDDTNEILIFSSNLLTTSVGSTSSQHLKIKVNGTEYRIALKNP